MTGDVNLKTKKNSGTGFNSHSWPWILNYVKNYYVSCPPPYRHLTAIGVGVDCALVPLRNGLKLVQTTDFLYPIVEDPFKMGQIACANVLSDLYAFGITSVDNLLMIVGLPWEMSTQERDITLGLLRDGFKERATQAGATIRGGDTKFNAWLMLGGVATSIVKSPDIIRPSNAKIGDAILLTKPLGTHLATTLYRWTADAEKLASVNAVITKSEIEISYNMALNSMIHLNRTAAHLMHLFEAHAATDITGYGLIGHAETLIKFQNDSVDFIIDKLPIIKNMLKVDTFLGGKFKLLEGRAIETSGGLLICLPLENVEKFQNALMEKETWESWQIGHVVQGNRQVKLMDSQNLTIVNVG